MKVAPSGLPDGRGLRVAVLHAAFNAPVVRGLVDGCVAALQEMGVSERGILRVEVPGAFELPVVARVVAESGRVDTVVALGAVIRGETDHYEHVARAAATGLATVALATGVPVAFGVLTVRQAAHARARSRPGPENKGAESARAAVATARVLENLRSRRVRARRK
jgi:6,7-dimethyl-8-ribityllumazine synthase